MKGESDIQKFVLKIQRAISTLTTRDHMVQVGNKVANDIGIRTRKGYAVAQNAGQKQNLRPLSKSYVEYRLKLISGDFRKRKKPLKHPRPTLWDSRIARKSALTLTGSMLDSLQVVAASNNSIVIEATGSDYRGISNNDKAKWNTDMGRPFLNMSEQEIQKARIFWLRRFSSLIKNINLR